MNKPTITILPLYRDVVSEVVFYCNDYVYCIVEGTGDNLLAEDIEDGYVDYYIYEYYEDIMDFKNEREKDGGIALLKSYFQDMFKTEEDVVKYFMKNEFGMNEDEYKIRRA